MTGNCALRRSLAAILMTLTFVAGCVTSPPTANTTNANEERWTCCVHQVGVYCPNAVDVTLTADRAKGTGAINFGDIVHNTDFYIRGFDRRWDWQHHPIRGYDYAFVIRPTLLGFYYDFTTLKVGETRKENDAAYTCERR